MDGVRSVPARREKGQKKMKCPYCNHPDTRVIDSRPADDGNSIRRRRSCDVCGKRFTTYEKVETIPLIIIKKDNPEYRRMGAAETILKQGFCGHVISGRYLRMIYRRRLTVWKRKYSAWRKRKFPAVQSESWLWKN